MRNDPARPERRWRGKVGYVVMGFPRLSESFISNELAILESLGARLEIYAIKRGDEGPVHESVSRLRATITRLPAMTSLSGAWLLPWLLRNAGPFARAHLSVLRRRPLAYAGALAQTLAMSLRYRRGPLAAPRKVFIKEFLQAGFIARAVLRDRDVVHLHGHFCHGATTVTWLSARLADVTFSFTAHAKDIYQADQNPGDLLDRKLRAASFAVTCTAANHAHIAGRCGDGARLHTVYHGLDTRYFAPAPRTASEPLPLILAVGRLVEKKGFADLIEACALLRARGLRFRLLLVGEDGPERATIEGAIAAHGLGDAVTLQGPVDHATLREHYRAATLFVLPCLVAGDGDRDGIPNVLAEAMATALPVISTAVSGIPELVEDGRNGLLVPPRDPARLADAIGTVLAAPELGATLGRAARETVCRIFDSSRTTRDLKALFERTRPALVAGEPRPGHSIPGTARIPA